MSLTDKVFAYCERGNDPAFWAEPLNAVSNVAFPIAAVIAFGCWRQSRKGAAELALIVVVFIIGIASFLFHTIASKWARFADVAPIAVFMLGYLVFALRRLLAFAWGQVAVGIGLFVAAGVLGEAITCGGGPCLNGSVGYLPAALALLLVASGLRLRRHPAAPGLLAAAVIFAVSLVMRSIDQTACPLALIQPDWRIGTHAVWHILNAVVLYALLRAAIYAGDLGANKAKVISK